MSDSSAAEIELRAPVAAEHADLLSAEALAFVAALVTAFRPRVRELIAARAAQQQDFDAGTPPDFLPETADIRAGDWCIAPLPEELSQRPVELTGPAGRKTLINGLNAPVAGFMADLDNAQSPTWQGLLDAQANLRDAVGGGMEYLQEGSLHYRLKRDHCPLMLRPRSWHLWEKHLYIDGEAVPGALFDVGLYLFHNARRLSDRGRGIYLYLPKLHAWPEARLWREILQTAARALGLAPASIRVSVLIETLPAAFQMDEILYELREHALALNCGRWDYVFSALRCLKNRPGWLLPDRQALGPEQPFLAACSRLLVATAHRRGALAIAGTSAYIPIRNDEAGHAEALAMLRAEKSVEAQQGYDGAWVAHPDLAGCVREVFEAGHDASVDEAAPIGAQQLLAPPQGEITEAGLRNSIAVGVQYLQAWLDGRGCVPLYNLMEDAATAEICRAQIWQWLHRDDAVLADGRGVTGELFTEVLAEEMDNIRAEVGPEAFGQGRFDRAAELFSRLCLADELTEYLSLPAYELLD